MSPFVLGSASILLLAFVNACSSGPSHAAADTGSGTVANGTNGSQVETADTSPTDDGLESSTGDPETESSSGADSANDSRGLNKHCIDPDDLDGDGIHDDVDNDMWNANPEQWDVDFDGHGDQVDGCVLQSNQSGDADMDRDGFNNRCDRCGMLAKFYNEGKTGKTGGLAMWVRNNPRQSDFDGDGIGDACDNCPSVPNCDGWGIGTEAGPFPVLDYVPTPKGVDCQIDDNVNQIGDACEGLVSEGAAGPVGFDYFDDFDQDGLANGDDACPRLPLAHRVACENVQDCHIALQGKSRCDSGICNHVDTDSDGVGDLCDNCPYVSNFEQIKATGPEGSTDDLDEDFIGEACEQLADCGEDYAQFRHHGMYEVSANGFCCVTTFDNEGYYEGEPDVDGRVACRGRCDPDGIPIMRPEHCPPEFDLPDGERFPDGRQCRRLPSAVALAVGVTALPPGCAQALAQAGSCDPNDPACSPERANRRLRPELPDEAEAAWAKLCWLPPKDLDFDGVGDSCDNCRRNYNPSQAQYVDEEGKLWPDFGAACFGKYSPKEMACEK